ncbi:MAG: gamma-glutamyl-gamma-aminobutyrate hydrolase family protein, partial [Lachnospiraceae bacterium]|nr:gamma-glutamyl-gamma-aminobutyrate hydrolase family protein [Lachnospiraceae bacterium]
FGGKVSYASRLMHGKASVTEFDRTCPLFVGCPAEAEVARYHSLAAVEDTLPECLKVTARTKEGEIMAVMHRDYPIYGVQFHPESILTPNGKQMLLNFVFSTK